MKYFFGFITIAFLLTSCSGGADTSSPKGTMAAFLEAGKKGDIEALKKLITKKDLGYYNTFTAMFANDSAKIEAKKAEFVEKFKDATYTIKDEKIDGEKAVVNVDIKDKDSTGSHAFNLLKEDGSWKVSLFGDVIDKIGDAMNHAGGEMHDSLMSHIKQMNPDSLKKITDKAMEKLEELKQKDPEAAKKLEEIMKKLGQH